VSGLPLKSPDDFIEATSSVDSFLQLSGVLRRVSVKLSKTCNDLRLLASGPRCGFGEINLPPMAGGLLGISTRLTLNRLFVKAGVAAHTMFWGLIGHHDTESARQFERSSDVGSSACSQ